MMRMRGLFAVVVLAACSSPTGPDEPDVVGSWQWLLSEGGIAGDELSPASEGYAVRITLDGDGTARALRNGSQVASASYELQHRLSIVPEGEAPEYEIRFEPDLAAFPFASIDGGLLRLEQDGTMHIEEPCCDRYTHTFEPDGGS